MRYFFIKQSDLAGSKAVVKGSDAHHIKNVLRLKPGDKIGLFDGTGLNHETRILSVLPKSIEVSIIRSFSSNTESNVNITVAQALLKDRKMDLLVRQLTELGITQWIPFIATRSIPRPDQKRLAARNQRWGKIATEAVKQCKRCRSPEIGATVSFEEVLSVGKESDLKIVFWEEESKPVDKDLLVSNPNPLEQIFILLGPEGGFTSKEVESAKASGFITAALGPRILRAETATLAACTMLQYLFGDMGK
ncbi:MAG: 16S rRNA (uracil(1498)-N(3))-methyltransferase [Thermodesulfobacteriota bacterium]|nr:16S rRNA (uracil(1498)-N(3))-methyltransferase [Thermodesulfobacteriota bacterium]